MKIKKYPQSCLIIETDNKTFLVDAGGIKYQDKYAEEWKKADYIFVTHKHGDHIKADVIKELNKPIYSTQEVQNKFTDINFNIVKENDVLEFGNVKVEVVKAIHGYNPYLKGGNAVLENVGYIFDDGNIRLYVTSDTVCFENDYKCDVVALPVTAHGLTMSAYEAALLSKDLEAKLVLPIHMDNDKYPTDVKYMEEMFAKFEVNYKVLGIEETIEL